MSLKGFHIVFLVLSALLAAVTLAWAWGRRDSAAGVVLLAGAGLVLVALVPYARWFRQKMRRLGGAGLLIGASLLLPRAAEACAVCWGSDSGSRWFAASNALFVFMLALTYLTVAGGVLGFVVARRRARREESR